MPCVPGAVRRVCEAGLAAWAMLLLTGCMVHTPDGAADLPAPADNTVSLSGDIQPVLSAQCVTCHRPGGLAQMAGIPMDLREGKTFGSIVNQPSARHPDRLLVKPGDAENSEFFRQARSIAGGSTLLTAEEAAMIRDWIDQGADDN